MKKIELLKEFGVLLVIVTLLGILLWQLFTYKPPTYEELTVEYCQFSTSFLDSRSDDCWRKFPKEVCDYYLNHYQVSQLPARCLTYVK